MKKAKIHKTHLGSVPAVMAASSVANSKTGEKIIDKSFRTFEKQQDFMREYLPKIFITGLVISGIVFGPKLYKRWRRNLYAKKNISNPNVQAAFIIRKAFNKIEFPGVLSWVLPDINLWTDKKTMFNIAAKVTNLDEVSKAYTILFDSILLTNLKNGFSSKDFENFFEIIQGKDGNPEPQRIILVGSEVFSAKKQPFSIKKAIYDKTQRKWKSTNELFATVSYKEKIGKVYAVIQYNAQSRFYIVDRGLLSRGYGLVWDKEITDKT
ncbi:hypothetical protein [Capnocytophaga catalasegens]|uniref:Tim44-like domain-containing protein n=1 Tax=Capnocytophaga catalasegens TaxID=1004260 RepID=A0AAV5B0H6_9FLAO|nr:hypothetical protein [Capnocytophaga catalasegens]GIZ16582.1 hypothetical protein RCZ03_25820 [Capnocytophaga catalasegens]GJM51587.1 hypothetical protein RCZ15_25600 [Capnocytophaga catalasegens]GJM53701.1 hypothetical protein RCZ16_20170 [Capnocytophaga catalasegens]